MIFYSMFIFFSGKTTHYFLKKISLAENVSEKHVSNKTSVAIKSYAIPLLTGRTFDGFIGCTLEQLNFTTYNFTI